MVGTRWFMTTRGSCLFSRSSLSALSPPLTREVFALQLHAGLSTPSLQLEPVAEEGDILLLDPYAVGPGMPKSSGLAQPSQFCAVPAKSTASCAVVTRLSST